MVRAISSSPKGESVDRETDSDPAEHVVEPLLPDGEEHLTIQAIQANS